MHIEDVLHFYYIYTLLGLCISSAIIILGSAVCRLLMVFGAINYKPTDRELEALILINVIAVVVMVISAVQLCRMVVQA